MATGRIPTTANSPLTVKGDLFGYSTTQSRVPVGNDGETLVADSSTSTGLRYGANFAAGKNKIINGDFYINQRNFSSGTTYDFGFDRFINAVGGGTGTATFSAQTFTPGTAPVAGYEGKNYLRCITTGQTAAGTFTIIQQNIEDVRTLAGQTATISFWAKAATGTPKIFAEFEQGFGSGGSANVNIGNSVTISTLWARYSVTLNVPSIAGKTIGTSSLLSLLLWVSAGSTFNTRTSSLGIQSNTFEVWGVQVEAGSTATAFQTATGTIQGELAACQRYYFRTTSGQASGALSTLGSVVSTVAQESGYQFPVTMRTSPTSIDFSNVYLYQTGASVTTVTSITSYTNYVSNQFSLINASVASGLTAGKQCVLVGINSSAYIGFSAEL
jgi:hypothetical protein